MTYRCKVCRKVTHSLTLRKRRCFFCGGRVERHRFIPVSNTDIASSLCSKE